MAFACLLCPLFSLDISVRDSMNFGLHFIREFSRFSPMLLIQNVRQKPNGSNQREKVRGKKSVLLFSPCFFRVLFLSLSICFSFSHFFFFSSFSGNTLLMRMKTHRKEIETNNNTNNIITIWLLVMAFGNIVLS